MENSMKPFLVGQKVKAFGCRGVVTKATEYVYVYFEETGNRHTFEKSGKHFDWHKLPSLKHVKFKTKKKLVPHWPALFEFALSPSYLSSSLFKNIDEARKCYPARRTVRLATEYPPVMLEEGGA